MFFSMFIKDFSIFVKDFSKFVNNRHIFETLQSSLSLNVTITNM